MQWVRLPDCDCEIVELGGLLVHKAGRVVLSLSRLFVPSIVFILSLTLFILWPLDPLPSFLHGGYASAVPASVRSTLYRYSMKIKHMQIICHEFFLFFLLCLLPTPDVWISTRMLPFLPSFRFAFYQVSSDSSTPFPHLFREANSASDGQR